MDFPPEEWVVFSLEEFTLAQPRNPGALGAEVMAQVRANGRITDHWRVALGGSEVLEAHTVVSGWLLRGGVLLKGGGLLAKEVGPGGPQIPGG